MGRIGFILVLLGALGMAWFLDLHHLFDLEAFRDRQSYLAGIVKEHPIGSGIMFFCAYLLVATFSIPGAAVLTLAGGALFGLAEGVMLVSFASSIGATLAFLMSRHVLRGTRSPNVSQNA